jgi:beta-mannosidase
VDVTYPVQPPRFAAAVTSVDGGARVTVTAETLLHDLALLADRVHPDAVVDDTLACLLPGETVTWTVTTSTRSIPTGCSPRYPA